MNDKPAELTACFPSTLEIPAYYQLFLTFQLGIDPFNELSKIKFLEVRNKLYNFKNDLPKTFWTYFIIQFSV